MHGVHVRVRRAVAMGTRAWMLALLLVRVCSACRTSGFPNSETVMDTAAGGEPPPELLNVVRVWLFPSLKFNCTGTITKWTFQAVRSGSGTMLPQMQVWRENSVTPLAEDYVLQSSSGTEDELRIIGDSVYLYVLITPVAVSEGDIFGVLLPESTDRELLLQFQNFGQGGAPLSYITPFNTTFLNTGGAQVAANFQYLPLVTAALAINPAESATATLDDVRSESATSTLSATPTPDDGRSASATSTLSATPTPDDGRSTSATSTLSATPTPNDGSSNDEETSTILWAIIGGVVGALFIGVLVLTTAAVAIRRFNQQPSKEHHYDCVDHDPIELGSREASADHTNAACTTRSTTPQSSYVNAATTPTRADLKGSICSNQQTTIDDKNGTTRADVYGSAAPHISTPTRADLEGNDYSDPRYHGEVNQERGSLTEYTDPQTKTADENVYTLPDLCGSNAAAYVNTPTRADLEAEGYSDPRYYGDVDVNKGTLSADCTRPDLYGSNSATQHSKSRYINTPTRADLEAEGYSDPRYYGD